MHTTQRGTNASDTQQVGRRELRHADDDALLAWARAGNRDAFDELYRRHHHDVRRYARGLTRRLLRHDIGDDIVAEAIRKTLSAIRHGKGPTSSFRRYLFACVRAATFTHARRHHEQPIDTLPDDTIDTSDGTLDGIIAMEAFRSLPHRWQQVIWATKVAELTLAEAADTLGITANSAGVLSSRARDGLRIAYVRAQLPSARQRNCDTVLNALARSVVTPIADTQARLIDQHTASCARCHTAMDTLNSQPHLHWNGIGNAFAGILN